MISKIKRILRIGVGLLFCVLSYSSASASPIEPFELKQKADSLLKQGFASEAVPLYHQVLQADSSLANAYYNLATAYYLQGKIREAAVQLERFLKFHPEDGEALYNLGSLKLRLGAFEDALDCFLRAEKCPCSPAISQKIKEALRFSKDLRSEDAETQELIAFLLTV